MARFFGHAPDYAPDEEREYNINPSAHVSEQEIVLSNEQGSQSLYFVCQEMNLEVKNLRMEVASLRQSIDHIKANNGQDASNKATSKKLPKGLSVSSFKAFRLLYGR